MSDTPTPMTDAKIKQREGMEDFVYADFARQLERELAEAKAQPVPVAVLNQIANQQEEIAKLKQQIAALLENTPNCPACAEQFWCGSTNAKHICGIPNSEILITAIDNARKEGKL